MLESRWNTGNAEFFVLYGRRRVGKTDLLDRFSEGKKALYFEATASKEVDHLADISALLAVLTGDPVLAQQSLTNWDAVLAAIGREAKQGPLLVVLDEFQHIARETRDIGTRLNGFWRRSGRSSELFLVLSGSDVSFFEKDVMGYSGATYGRRTGSYRLEPFRPRDVRLFLPGWDPRDLVRAYAVFGGVPYYLDSLSEKRSLAENIWASVLAPGALLREEPSFIFSQEGRIRESRPYFTALRAIAAGRSKHSEIAQRVADGDTSATSGVLETLQEMRLVRREHRVTVTNPERSKISRYVIEDPFLRFWFRFVLPFSSRLRTGESARRHLRDLVMPSLDEFVSAPAFEEVCQGWLAEELDAAAAGRWWGKLRETTPGGPRSVDAEADVVAVDSEGAVLAIGSCKWTRGSHGDAERKKLERIADEICVRGEKPRLFFFSRSGFGSRLKALSEAEPDRYRLVSVEELYGGDRD